MPERVLITGCSRGIGLALAEEFARRDWEVFATARTQGSALATLSEKFSQVKVLSLDVRDEASIAESAAHLADRSLDVLVNNAAIFPGEGNEPFERVQPEWFNDAFDCNVTGVARVTRAFLPPFKKNLPIPASLIFLQAPARSARRRIPIIILIRFPRQR